MAKKKKAGKFLGFDIYETDNPKGCELGDLKCMTNMLSKLVDKKDVKEINKRFKKEIQEIK